MMSNSSPMRNEPTESLAIAPQANLADRILRQSKLIFFFGGLVLMFVGWTTGDAAITSQNIAIARGLTACGLLLAGGLSFVAAAIVYHRDGAFAQHQPARNQR
jgi:positive regulator of sigma E activity